MSADQQWLAFCRSTVSLCVSCLTIACFQRLRCLTIYSAIRFASADKRLELMQERICWYEQTGQGSKALSGYSHMLTAMDSGPASGDRCDDDQYLQLARKVCQVSQLCRLWLPCLRLSSFSSHHYQLWAWSSCYRMTVVSVGRWLCCGCRSYGFCTWRCFYLLDVILDTLEFSDISLATSQLCSIVCYHSVVCCQGERLTSPVMNIVSRLLSVDLQFAKNFFSVFFILILISSW